MSVLRIMRMMPFLIRAYSFLDIPLKMFSLLKDSSRPVFFSSLRLFPFVSRHNLKRRAVWCLSKGESSEYLIASLDCVEISKEFVLEV